MPSAPAARPRPGSRSAATRSPRLVSAGRPAATWFPVYGYIEYSHIRRVSSDLDLGLRLTLQVSTLDLLPREGVPVDPAERIQSAIEAYQTSPRGETTSPPPNVGVT